MDPPPSLPLQPSIVSTAATSAAPVASPGVAAAASVTQVVSCPDSDNSSPRCRHTDNNLDESLPLVPGTAKLRLMCSYGGHIIPRPHDKSLCYVGGDTRMVVVDRNPSLSLSDLSARLSRTLLSGRRFALKYQLPNEDLDSLISVSTDEDLENMIEEYDRITNAPNSSSKPAPARLRLFLFPAKPETAASMGSLLDDAKSETWFVDALNGSGLLPRGLSDSAVGVDCVLELDDGAQNNEFPRGNFIKQLVGNVVQDVQTAMPDSPMVETNSSFGSSSSAPSMSNLPTTRVQVEDGGGGGARFQDQMVCLDENFSHMAVAHHPDGAVAQKQDEERSDIQGTSTVFRKPPLPLPLQPVQQKFVDAYNLPSAGIANLPSPDSVASDCSIGYATNPLLKHTAAYQETTHVATSDNGAQASPIDPTTGNNISDPSSQIQVHDSPYVFPPPPQQIQQQQQQQQQQSQYAQYSTQHYIHHHPGTGQLPMSSYYHMYAPPPSQQQIHHHQFDPQYQMYFLPVAQNQPNPQAYNLQGMQSNIADATVVASSRPTMTANQTTNRTAATDSATPTLVQVASTNQFPQQQYMGVPQMHHHASQAIGAATSVNYGYEYHPPNPTHEQVYYAAAQHHPAATTLPPPPQYQTMTPATAVLLQQAAAQLPADNNTTQQ